MAASHSPERYTHVIHEAEVGGGWSGQLRIVVGNNGQGAQDLVFVDSDLLGPRRLVLTAEEAVDVATQLAAAAGEVLPPASSDFRAFESVFGYPAPAEHSKTLADLSRHIRELSDQHEAEKRRAAGR
jgi:hypothetical protein